MTSTIANLRTGHQGDGLREFYKTMPRVQELTVIEIGSFRGESAAIASEYVKSLWCVDPWCPQYGVVKLGDGNIGQDEYVEFLRRAETLHNIAGILRIPSVVAASLFPDETFDAVYIDGLHQYRHVKQDILAWTPKVKSDGWICGHDYNELHVDVRRAVDELLGVPPFIFDDSSWRIKKPSPFPYA